MTRKLLPFIKKLIKFSIKNYLITAFIAIIVLVGLVSAYKIFFSESTYVYARVKVGQGFWWVSTTKPSIWYVQSIKKGEREKNLFGEPTAEILTARYFPTWGGSQFDTYLTVKLRVGIDSKSNRYTFKRSMLSVGSPIELQFPSINITGTVTRISQKPFEEKYVEKTIFLVNRGGYTKDFPYLFETIKVGDTYFDGEQTVFEVLDKTLEENIWAVQNNLNAQVYERSISTTQNIVVKSKIRAREDNNQLIYGEEYAIKVNSYIPLMTKNYIFNDFVIRAIQD